MRWFVLKEGWKAAWPICLGYIPIGLAFGVLAQKAGLHPGEIALMSIIVFAGSAQFIAVSMLAAGADALAIIGTTFMVNLRHLLMSSSLAVFFGNADRFKLTLLAYGVTDESFAVNLGYIRSRPWDIHHAIALNQTANAVWILSTIAGGYGSRFIPRGAFGLDYALIAMFICLLIFQLRGPLYLLTACIAGGLAVGFSLLMPGNGYIILASVCAATLGILIKKISAYDERKNGIGK